MPDAPPQLPYRSGRDEPTPPSGLRVLTGVFLVLLAIAATSLGGLIVLFTVADMYSAGSSVGPAVMLLIAVTCFTSNLWLVPRAAKLFRRRLPAGAGS